MVSDFCSREHNLIPFVLLRGCADQLRLNKEVKVIAHPYHLSSENAVETLELYDVVLDCTDRPATRYLVSDAAVVARIPLVHGSALQTEGQLMVLNNPPTATESKRKGPCYRCIWPKPPPIESILTCGEGGILGPVVGVMGVLMAAETLRIIIPALQKQPRSTEESPNRGIPFLMYSAYTNPPFRSLTMRGTREDCFACNKALERQGLKDYDYDSFCGNACLVNILSSEERMDPKTYHTDSTIPGNAPILIDVRDETQFEMCHIQGAINLPWSEIRANPTDAFQSVNTLWEEDPHSSESRKIVFICRHGNDSQLAVRLLKAVQQNIPGMKGTSVTDIRGGLKAWREKVDPDFPDY